MMKILHIHTKMVSGGIEAIVCGLVNEMSKTEDVTLCTIFEPNEEDVFYKRVSNNVKKITAGKTKSGFSIKEIFTIARIIRKDHYDVVHVHGCFQYYFLAMLLYHKRTRFFYTIHSDARKENQTTTQSLFSLKKYMFAHRWVIPVTISYASQKSFADYYNCSSELVFNGTPKPVLKPDLNEICEYRYTENTRVFIHAGRITKAKNQIVLCKVFSRIISEGNDVVLLIAGSPEEECIFNEISKYFSNRIIYLGERNDIPSLFAQSDAFCLPSIWEGLPVTLLEALSVACIPVCSPVGGIVDIIIDGVNGFLSKSSAENDYYNAVMRFLSSKAEKVNAIKNDCLNTFKKYDIENTSNSYLKLYSRYK